MNEYIKITSITGLTVLASLAIFFIVTSQQDPILNRRLRSTPRNQSDYLKGGNTKGGEAWSFNSCPPPPVTRSMEICKEQVCRTNHECLHGQSCCFNGCIRTCVSSLPRPQAFDWVEDTSKIHPILGEDFMREDPDFFQPIAIPKQKPTYEAAEGGGESVVLAGGCIISAQKFEELKKFMTAPSIENCSCQGPEVICHIKTRKM